MKKRKKSNLKDTLHFGYIGYNEPRKIQELLQNHQLFSAREIKVTSDKDLVSLINNLKNGNYDYIIIPAKNESNEVNDMFLSLISRLEIEGINEIGMLIDDMAYQYCSTTNNDIDAVTENPIDSFKSGNKTSTYHFSNDPKENTFSARIEYRIFKINDYKAPLLTRFEIWLLKNDHLKHMLGWTSGLVAAAMIVFLIFRLIPSINDKLEDISIMVELIATSIIIVLQLILRLANAEEKIKRKLICGYWIYYSIEETDANQNFVPKGFRTRLVNINDFDDRLTFKCKFSGEDQIFFATDTLTFDYDQSSQMGRGFYYYTSNIQNNKKRRAEGTCRFEGEAIGNKQIMVMTGWFFGRGTSITGKVLYFRISKEDYIDLQKSLTFYDLNTERDQHLIIGVYGCKASNTDSAARNEEVAKAIIEDASQNDSFFKELLASSSTSEYIEYHYYDSVKDMRSALANHQIDYAVVPTSNRGQLIEEHNIFEEKTFLSVLAFEKEIKYVLATLDEHMTILDDTIFYGHKQSRLQCLPFLEGHQYVETSSSAQAALNMSKGYYGGNAVVLCNEDALSQYHLKAVLDSNNLRIDPYQGEVKNITTFTIYRVNKEKQ